MDMEFVSKLGKFIEFVSTNPTILNDPQLEFIKKFIESFGGKIPSGEFKMPTGGGCPFGGNAKTENKPADKKPSFKNTDSDDDDDEEEPVSMDTDPESEIELDMEGVIEGDSDETQEMGDATKVPTEDEIEKASELRSKAAAAYSEQKYDESIALYTKAIELNPGNALFHAKRGQAFLKLQKPNACIRDCDKALELNCDSAAAYKFRGRAHRMLGNWEAAAKDLRQACKIDFDEETDEWLREVTPNAKKIEQHRIKYDRKQAEQRIRAQQLNAEREKMKKKNEAPPTSVGFPGGFPGGLGGFNVNDLLGSMKDPEISAAFQDIATNPANIDKYKNNPKISALIDVMNNMSGGLGGFMGKGGAAKPTPAASSAADDTSESKEDKKKPPSFVDDGLD